MPVLRREACLHGYVPGAKVTFDRNPDYVPRNEPADGNAGGKRVFVDKVEWDIIPDLQTRVAALLKGEVDLLDQLPHDGLQSFKGHPDIVIDQSNNLGNLAFLRVNTLQPPFNDVRARRAMALLVDQKDYLAAAFTDDFGMVARMLFVFRLRYAERHRSGQRGISPSGSGPREAASG